MLPYFIVFAIVLINTYFIAKMKKNNNKAYIVLLVINILFIACFAGLRDDTVGYDIGTYVKKPFEWAKNMPFMDFLNSNNLEKGFGTILYLTSLMFQNYHVFLIFIQIIITSCVYYYGLKSEKNILFIVFIYLMVFFNDTMSYMKQSIAYCILLASMIPFKEKKYLKTAIIFFGATLFHSSAIVMLVVYAIYYINNLEDKKNRQIFNIVTVFLVVVAALFYRQITYVLCYNIKILPEKFYLYFSSKYYNTNNMPIVKLIFSSAIVVYEYYLARIKKDKNMSYLIFAIVNVALIIMSYQLENIIRLSEYFMMITLIDTLPEVDMIFKNDEFNKKTGMILVVGVLIVYWIYIFGRGATVPYTSEILHVG